MIVDEQEHGSSRPSWWLALSPFRQQFNVLFG